MHGQHICLTTHSSSSLDKESSSKPSGWHHIWDHFMAKLTALITPHVDEPEVLDNPTNLLRRFMPQAMQSSIAVLQHFHLIFAAWLIPYIVRLCCTSLLLLMIRQQWKCQSTAASLSKGYDILDCWSVVQPGLWALLWPNYEPNPEVQSCWMKLECCQSKTACMRGVQAVHGCQCAV